MNRNPHTLELAPPVRDGEAEIGERITVLDLTTSAVDDYRLVACSAARAGRGDVSIRTALGSALLGRHVGDVVSVERAGVLRRLEVVELDG